MFGIGNRNRGRRGRNETFGSSNLKNAALAGVGMLAWRWWRNRSANRTDTYESNKSFNDSPTHTAGTM